MTTKIQRAVVTFVMLLALTVQVGAQDLPVLGQGTLRATRGPNVEPAMRSILLPWSHGRPAIWLPERLQPLFNSCQRS